MTVQELIDALTAMPKEAIVIASARSGQVIDKVEDTTGYTSERPTVMLS